MAKHTVYTVCLKKKGAHKKLHILTIMQDKQIKLGSFKSLSNTLLNKKINNII